MFCAPGYKQADFKGLKEAGEGGHQDSKIDHTKCRLPGDETIARNYLMTFLHSFVTQKRNLIELIIYFN